MKYPNYVEMPLKEAIKTFPELLKVIPKEIVFNLLSDERYVVRFDKFNHIEFGFASDDWFIH